MALNINLSGQNSYLLKTNPIGGEIVVTIDPFLPNGTLYPIIFVEIDASCSTSYTFSIPDLATLNGNVNVVLVLSNSSEATQKVISKQSINSSAPDNEFTLKKFTSFRLTGTSQYSYSLVPTE